ncbi:sialidase-3-like [Clarias gariepinus]|uniref:sialidase-4-like isoform X2 n=1 Tax=Clarias gariepinus TaxID=13013 RepID=UPI00234E36B0|nr:sialidase-4-like isoform X2 [Clarias gariepinus]XP_053370878.1 sialidase-4-like isoform X2 [Clarias gariepinus]
MGECVSKTSFPTLNPEPSKLALFTNTDTEFYRIPALIYIHDSETFLALAEKRTSLADVDATRLVLRRGTREDGRVQWSDMQELTGAGLDGYRTMNPCPVYEKQTKTVFLFFICVYDKVTEQEQINRRENAARLCFVKSADSGQTWSETTDLTDTVIGDEIKKWATFGVGPGHGIQMTNGRLIIPAYAYYVDFFGPKPQAFAFYSDDRGDTWKSGQRISAESGECQMAEIISSDGKSYLYCNARHGGFGDRFEAWSENGGESFNKSQCEKKVVETGNGCQASVVSFKHGDETWLLFSQPTDRCNRKNLGVYVNKSPVSGCDWIEPRIINPGYSGYSDLTQCGSDLHFACLLERGTSTVEETVFVEFPLSDIKKSYEE